MEHHQLGKNAEEEAVRQLKKKGYEILEINWRTGRSEIDIIARTAEHIVFVEVKARKNTFFGEPEEFVNHKKRKTIIRAAHAYMMSRNIILEARFDIFSVVYSSSGTVVSHIENAFYPTL